MGDEIVESVASLDKMILYRPDKYKKNNDGSYRAFQVFSYRISYRITTTEIKMLRLRHIKNVAESILIFVVGMVQFLFQFYLNNYIIP